MCTLSRGFTAAKVSIGHHELIAACHKHAGSYSSSRMTMTGLLGSQGLIQYLVINSWCLVDTFAATKPFDRAHTKSTIPFHQKATDLFVCPSSILSRMNLRMKSYLSICERLFTSFVSPAHPSITLTGIVLATLTIAKKKSACIKFTIAGC